MAVSAEDIKNFVMANLDNPSAIAQAAQQYGVSSDAIASAVGVPVSTVTSYFADAGVTAPPPAAVTPPSTPATVAPPPTQPSTPTPPPVTPTVPSAPSAPSAPSNALLSDPSVQNTQGMQEVLNQLLSGNLTAQLQQTGAGGQQQYTIPGLLNPTQGQSSTYGSNQLDIRPVPGTYSPGEVPTQYSVGLPSSSGTLSYYFTIDPKTKKVIPNTNPSTALKYEPGTGGIISPTVIAMALSYAIPIAGEYLAAQMSTAAGFAVPNYVGSALAATMSGVAQGQDIVTAATNALPGLVANGIMSQTQANDLLNKISSDPKTQQMITNGATSVLQTASKGGTPTDIANNLAASVVGTYAGQQSGSQTLANVVANTLVGGVQAGVSSGLGSMGSQQANLNAITRNFDNMIPTTGADGTQKFLDPKTQNIYNLDGTVYKAPTTPSSSKDPGIVTAANAPTNLDAVAASALPAMLGTGNEKAGPIQSNTESDGSVTYSRTITGIDASGKEYQYVATYDPLETTPNRQVSYSIPSTIGSSDAPAPSVSGTASSYTRPTFEQPPNAQGVSITPPDIKVDVANVGKTGNAPGTPGGVIGKTDTTAITGGTPTPTPPGGGLTTGATNVIGGLGTVGLGGTTGPGTGPVGTGTPGTGGTGGTGTGGGGPGTPGSGPPTGPGTGPAEPPIPPIPPRPPTPPRIEEPPPETPPPEEPPPPVEEPPSITVSTSKVTPKIKASYPTITGQFASPVTQAISAYRPPGDVESQATGKEREDVWNVESLRNALGI